MGNSAGTGNTGSGPRRSPLALVVLSLLAEESMHPYRMREMIKQRGKGKVANVAQRNSVYQVIDRLLRDELISVAQTARSRRRPERTVYAITELGMTVLRDWTRQMLAAPAPEFPEFPAGLATVMVLEPADALRQLEARAAALERLLESQRAEAKLTADLPRVVVLDDEYAREMTAARLRWVRSLVADLRSGDLHWTEEGLREAAKLAESGE